MKKFVRDLTSGVRENSLMLASAGVAFYFFLAFVPGLIAVISLYGLLFNARTAAEQIKSIASTLPDSAADLVTDQLHTIIDASSTGLGFGFVAGVVVALWSASSGMQNLIRGISVAYGSDEKRGYVRLRAMSLLLTFGAIIVGVGSIYAVTVLPGWLSAAGLQTGTQNMVEVLRWPALVVVLMISLAFLYRIAVYRPERRHGWLTWGALVAAVLWAVGSGLFGYFVSNFGRYNEVYGSLAGVIVLLLWLLLTSFSILLGAEINAVTVSQQPETDAIPGRAASPAPEPGASVREVLAGFVLVAFAVGAAIRRRRTR